MKLVGAFTHGKALIGAFSVIVKTDGSFAALIEMHKSAHVHTTIPHPFTSQYQIIQIVHG